MLDSPEWLPPLANDTVHATKAVFNLANAYLIIGDQAGQWLRDIDLVDEPAAPELSATNRIRLALITIFQFAEDLPDRLAADAVCTRMDWKYALHLPLNSPGFDATLLREYRQCLAYSPLDQRVLQRLVERVAAIGLLSLAERQTIDMTDVLISVGNLNRIEDLFEALRAALVVLAARWPDWLRSIARPHWYERYTRREVNLRLPHGRSEQKKLAKTIGEDAAYLLAVFDSAQLEGTSNLVEIRLLRQSWQQQFAVH
jgi:transposase